MLQFFCFLCIAIPKPCTISVTVTAVTGISEPFHFSLKFCSPMEYLYHKMRHDPYRKYNSVINIVVVYHITICLLFV